MSTFMPEGSSKGSGANLTPATGGEPSSQEDVALMKRVFAAASANPLSVPESFWQYALEYIQVNRFTIPVSQVFGYGQNVRSTAIVHQGSQSIPDSVSTKVVWASATYDPSAMWNGTDALGVPIDGVYSVKWTAQIPATVGYAAGLQFGFAAGGTFQGAGSAMRDTPFGGGYAPGSIDIQLFKGQSYALYASQTSGAPVSFIGINLSVALITAL